MVLIRSNASSTRDQPATVHQSVNVFPSSLISQRPATSSRIDTPFTQTSPVDSDQTLTQILSSDLQHSVTCTSESVDDSPLFIQGLVSPPDVKFCLTVSAGCPPFPIKTKLSSKSYFAGPAKKKQKDINGKINIMIEARRTVLEAKSALADETSKQQGTTARAACQGIN